MKVSTRYASGWHFTINGTAAIKIFDKHTIHTIHTYSECVIGYNNEFQCIFGYIKGRTFTPPQYVCDKNI